MKPHELLDVQAHAIPEDLKPLAELQAAREDDLLSRENVVGVAVGRKIKDGEWTSTSTLMVMVRQKLPEEMLAKSDVVPKTVDRRPTDVIEVGELFAGGAGDDGSGRLALSSEIDPLTLRSRVRIAGHLPDVMGDMAAVSSQIEPFALRNRVRPVRPGFSCGHPNVTAGTIGAGCYDLNPFPSKPSRYYILSNNHVIANSNAANIGDPILQPGPFDGGSIPNDVIGRLSRYIPIRFDGTCNTVDAAIAEVPFHLLDRDVYWLGVPRSGAVAAQVGMMVRKTGRTTSFTTGRVTAVNATVNINFGGGRVARFCNQIVTNDMSEGGDSGSLVLDLEGNPVGLLFAGSAVATILNPIATVQLSLGIRIWP